MALFPGGIGWVAFQFARNVAGIVATAATGASDLGICALMMQAYSTIHMLLAYMPAGTPLAAAHGYIMDAFAGNSPVPPPTTIPFIQSLDPRLLSAAFGTILTFLGCVKKG